MKNVGRIPWHSGINDIIRRAFASVQVPAVLGPSLVYRDYGKRPGSVTLTWFKGKCLLWDATCADNLVKNYISTTYRSAGPAARNAETRKYKKYEGVSNIYNFVPFPVETLGPLFGKEALALVNDLQNRLIEKSEELRSNAYRTQRISKAI